MIFCWHKWKIIGRYTLVDGKGGPTYGTRYDLQCEKCGTVKSKDL